MRASVLTLSLFTGRRRTHPSVTMVLHADFSSKTGVIFSTQRQPSLRKAAGRKFDLADPGNNRSSSRAMDHSQMSWKATFCGVVGTIRTIWGSSISKPSLAVYRNPAQWNSLASIQENLCSESGQNSGSTSSLRH